jgi:hypothetical protein
VLVIVLRGQTRIENGKEERVGAGLRASFVQTFEERYEISSTL